MHRTPASEWVREKTKGRRKVEAPLLSSALIVRERKKRSPGWVCENYLGYFTNMGNYVGQSSEGTIILSSPYLDAHGVSIIKENLFNHTAFFTARKSIKGNWINDKDQYMKPNKTHTLYEQFSFDSVVYALFNNSSQQSSLRQVTYAEELWDIKNEFFWLSKAEMIALAEQYDYDALKRDAEASEERFLYRELNERGLYDKLSPDARMILDYATDLLKNTIAERKLLSAEHPEYHLDSWDAGWAQLKLIWKVHNKEEFKIFREMYKQFENRLRPLIYELGFLKQ